MVEEDPPEVVVKEDPPRSSGGRGHPLGSGSGRGPPPGKDQTRPAEKYCWESGQYALEKRLPCSICFDS